MSPPFMQQRDTSPSPSVTPRTRLCFPCESPHKLSTQVRSGRLVISPPRPLRPRSASTAAAAPRNYSSLQLDLAHQRPSRDLFASRGSGRHDHRPNHASHASARHGRGPGASISAFRSQSQTPGPTSRRARFGDSGAPPAMLVPAPAPPLARPSPLRRDATQHNPRPGLPSSAHGGAIQSTRSARAAQVFPPSSSTRRRG
ncbi:hypothetical protein BU15DRAFT_70038 [Melanogaster broomeanus]|nr:hypothetical protein BU15DRAFT_70038 [Melanogaster broomeanus]